MFSALLGFGKLPFITTYLSDYSVVLKGVPHGGPAMTATMTNSASVMVFFFSVSLCCIVGDGGC